MDHRTAAGAGPLALTYLGSLDDRVRRYPFCPRPPRRPTGSRELHWRLVDMALTGPPGIIDEGFLLQWEALDDPAIGESVLGLALQHGHLMLFSRLCDLSALVADRRRRGVTSVLQRQYREVEQRALATLTTIADRARGFVAFPPRVVDQGTHRLLLRALQEQRPALVPAEFTALEWDRFGEAYLAHRRGAAGPPKTARTAWEDAALTCFGGPAGRARVHRLMRLANRARHLHQAACIQVQTGRPTAVETGLGSGLQHLLAEPPRVRQPRRQVFPPLQVDRASVHRHFDRIAPALADPDHPLRQEKDRWLRLIGECARDDAPPDAVGAAFSAQRAYEREIRKACGDPVEAGFAANAVKLAAGTAAGVVSGRATHIVIDRLERLRGHLVDTPAGAPPPGGAIDRRGFLAAGVGLSVGWLTLDLQETLEHRMSCLLPSDEADLDAWTLGSAATERAGVLGAGASLLCFAALDPAAAQAHVQALPKGRPI